MTTQTDPNEAYNAKVREVAESITRIMHVTAYNDRSKSIPDSNYWQIKVAGYEDAARAMVAKMANEYRAGLFAGRESNKKWASIKTVDAELMERGLIPNTKTDNDA